MATAKKTVTAKPAVFDVAKPGAPAIAPSSNSRSIIIKHAPVQDPMVNETPKVDTEKPADEPQTAPPLVSPSAKKIVIQPIHHDEEMTVDVTDEAKPEAVPTEPEAIVTQPVETAPKSEEVLAPKPADKPTNDDTPIIDDESQAVERSKRIAQLVASEEYFLPIQTIEQRRSKRTAIFGVSSIVLLLIAWYNVSLDAKLLPNNYNLPHTSFFSEK